MYHGHYFRLDTECANIEKGIAVFRYRPDGKADSDIYATFTDDEIEFNSIGGDPGRNVVILRIPVDENIERNFAGTVTDQFHRRVVEVSVDPQEFAHLSYFSTFYFGMKSKHLEYWKKPRPVKVLHGSPAIPEPLSVRKIILDFFFDLRETDVFRMSSHYDGLNERLDQIFFARCLLAKARYWYRRAVCGEPLRGNVRAVGADARREREAHRQFYGTLLFKAEKEWAECIRDPRSDKTFHEEFYDWFDESETEMRRIYSPYLSAMPQGGILRDMRREHNRLVSKWFVARYCGLTSWRILLSGHGSFFGSHLFLPRLFFSIATGWFMIMFIENISDAAKNTNLERFISMICLMILIVSFIIMKRVVPYAGSLFIRAAKLSGLVLLISAAVGGALLPVVADFEGRFVFALFSAAFIGLVIQIFMPGDNPGDPL